MASGSVATDDQRLAVRRASRSSGARAGAPAAADRAEVLADQRLDARRVEVADRDDRHQVRPVPVAVEAPQRRRRKVLQRLRACRSAAARRSGLRCEQDGELPVAACAPRRPGRAATPRSPPRAPSRPRPSRRRSPCAQSSRICTPVSSTPARVGRDGEHVDGLVEARVGVDVGPEAHPDALQVVRRAPASRSCAVPLNAMCSTKCASPRWSSSSSTLPAFTTSRSSARLRARRCGGRSR